MFRFILRTGKRLAKRVTEIAIQFRSTPFMLFRKTPIKDPRTNRLVIHIQPDEGISWRFAAKVPRFGHEARDSLIWISTTRVTSADRTARAMSGCFMTA